MGGKVFCAHESLTFATLDDYGFIIGFFFLLVEFCDCLCEIFGGFQLLFSR